MLHRDESITEPYLSKTVVLNLGAEVQKGAVSWCQGCCQLIQFLIFMPIGPSRGAAKYLQNLIREPQTKKGWETLAEDIDTKTYFRKGWHRLWTFFQGWRCRNRNRRRDRWCGNRQDDPDPVREVWLKPEEMKYSLNCYFGQLISQSKLSYTQTYM